MRDHQFTIHRKAGSVPRTPQAEKRSGPEWAKVFFALLLVLVAVPVCGQTKLDLRTQGKNVDFSTATSTRPAKTGTVLPAQCLVGEMFFKTDASSGSNVFGCVATNTWALQGTQTVPSITGQSGAVLINNGTSLVWSGIGGDLSGSIGSSTVVGLQGRPISSATPSGGQAIAWNATSQRWEPQTISGGSGGSLAIEAEGSSVGTRSLLNFQGGNGIMLIGSDTGSKIQMQYVPDSAVLQTKASAQSGTASYCASASNNGMAYTCLLTPTLLAYTTGMVINWKADIANTGAATLNIDLIGAVPLRKSDGTNVSANDIQAGRLYPLWYDGTGFRLPAAGGGGGGTTLGTLSRIWCPLGNCQVARDLRMSMVAARSYFFRFAPDRDRAVRRIAVPLYPWTGSDTLAIGLYNAAGSKQAECNTRVNAINVSGSFPVCTFSSTVTLSMDTEYYLVVASETAATQLDCTADGPSYEMHTLFGGRSDLFPGSKMLLGYSSNAATGTGTGFTLPAAVGTENSAALCSPQFFTFPQ